MKLSATLAYQYDSPFSPFSPRDFEQGLDWAVKSELDGVEICISDYHNVDPGTLAKKLEVLGLFCSTISTGQAFGREDISLTHPDKNRRALAIARVNQHIDAAAILKSRVTIGLLRGRGDIGVFAESVRPCLEYAEKNDVCLLLEPINRYETNLINSTNDAINFLERMGNPPNLKILWDIFHANIEDASFADVICAMGSKLGHVHLADSNRGFPGSGHIDFVAIFTQFGTIGYTDWLSFECLNMQVHDKGQEAIQ